MQNKNIVITGGPGTGKSSVINHLESLGFPCLHEVSREITSRAQREGIEQLFLEKPLLFSEMLLEARIAQHNTAVETEGDVFLDRGIPDIVAYMDYFNSSYPSKFTNACRDYRYDLVFLLPPWQEIYLNDSERYESFEQALVINENLKNTYIKYGYKPLEVPKETIQNRSDFILNKLMV